MQGDYLSRRSVLATTAGCALTGVGIATVSGQDDDESSGDEEGVTRDSFPIMEGTDQETTVHVTTADADGPTVIVVGGVHGNEDAGYMAADKVVDWTIDAGTLVTIPRTNAVAIERGTRTNDEGVDLNRQFHEGDDPETELARAVWDVVSESDPDVVVDLHESRGVYADDPVDGVGQAIFHSGGDEAVAAAADTVDYVTRNYVDDSELAFQTGPFSRPDNNPQGLLVHKAARDLGADAFLAETLSVDVDLETRVQWHSVIVERLVTDELVSEDEPDNEHVPDEPEEAEPDEAEEPDDVESDEDASDGADADDSESPSATIKTVPEDVDELALEAGQTIELDASCSSAAGDIVDYEWDVGRTACFDETGETITVTIGASGRDSVVLRVVDDDGLTDTDSITLSTD